MITKKFLRSVGTGLLSDNIKFQIKPFLDDPAVSDEMLIERINEVAILEAERLNKLKKSTAKPAYVNELHTSVSGEAMCSQQTSPTTPVTQPGRNSKDLKEKPLTTSHTPETDIQAIVRELKVEMSEMKQMVLASMSTDTKPNRRQTTREKGTWRRGCRICQDKGEGDSCNHCFKCGQSGHGSRGCRAAYQPPGNGGGLLSRDRQ